MGAPDVSGLRPDLELLARTTECLRDANIGYGIYSGFHAQMLAGHRVSKDVDIWADERRYGDMRELFPDAMVQERLSAAGKQESFSLTLGDGTVSIVGATVMRHAGTAHPADFAAVRERTAWREFESVADYFVDPVDTVIGKAITQRGNKQGKHDIADILAITGAVAIDKAYLLRRVAETRSSPKVIPLLRHLGIITNKELREHGEE